jgi:hypothetical protein
MNMWSARGIDSSSDAGHWTAIVAAHTEAVAVAVVESLLCQLNRCDLVANGFDLEFEGKPTQPTIVSHCVEER